MSALRWASAAYLIVLVASFYLGLGTARRHHIESASFIFVATIVMTVVARRPTSGTEPVVVRPARSPSILFGLAMLAGAFVLYGPVIGSGLFADDFVLLDAARQGRWTVWSELFRPVIFPIWRALDRGPADVAVSLHVLNIALHAANAVMTGALAWRLGLSWWAGAAAAVLFLSFPASVEPVAWPAGLQDVLMTSFALGFLLHMARSTMSAPRALAAVALLVAACLTKESGITAIPLAALVCLATRARRSTWMTLGSATALAGALLAVRLSILPVPAAYRVLPSRYHAKELLVRPFATLVLPFRDAELAAVPWLPVLLVVVVAAALCLAATRWDRHNHGFHLVLMCAAFVLASIAAASSIFYIDGDLLGSRYLYLGSVGWAILLATLNRDLMSRSIAIGGLFTLVMTASWLAAARTHLAIWKAAAAERDLIVAAAEKARPTGCSETVVEGLPQVRHGVPLFVNGFPEAMRTRLLDVRFRVPPAGTEQDGCRIVWTGAGFRSP